MFFCYKKKLNPRQDIQKRVLNKTFFRKKGLQNMLMKNENKHTQKERIKSLTIKYS